MLMYKTVMRGSHYYRNFKIMLYNQKMHYWSCQLDLIISNPSGCTAKITKETSIGEAGEAEAVTTAKVTVEDLQELREDARVCRILLTVSVEEKMRVDTRPSTLNGEQKQEFYKEMEPHH